MRSVIAIRTNSWGHDARSVAERLQPIFGEDLRVVFHDRPADLDTGLETIDINDDWLERNGLRSVPDWGWRCGDYFHYAQRLAVPDADQYWLIEPDVHFTSAPDSFFGDCAVSDADVLALDVVPFHRSTRWTRGMAGVTEFYRAVFALTRLSGSTIDMLMQRRKEYSSAGVFERAFANDEMFVFHHVMTDPNTSVVNLRDVAPTWFEGAHFESNPSILSSTLRGDEHANKVFHPVASVEGFKDELSDRITAYSRRFLPKMRTSVRSFSDADVDDVARQVSDRIAEMLNSLRTPPTS